jgi:type VI secretion system secreted protein Hcp
MPIYMKIDGITGSATEQNHTGWIEVHSKQYGVGRSITGTGPGATKGREGGVPSISEFVMSKPACDASHDLMRESMLGTVPGKKVEIHVTRTGPSNEQVIYEKFELENCMISGFSRSCSSNDTPQESVSLNFTKITYSISQQETDATTGNAKTSYYDLSLSKGG